MLQRDKFTVSSSLDDVGDTSIPFLETDKVKKIQERAAEELHQVTTLPNIEPTMTSLFVAFSQKNTQIGQQNEWIGALEKELHSRYTPRKHRHQEHT